MVCLQVDIPPSVDSDDLVSRMTSEGMLSVEAPVDDSYTPAIEPPAYPAAIENDDVYYVARTSPREHHYTQIHQSSPFAATDGYNLHSNKVITSSSPPRPQTTRYYSSTTQRSPQPPASMTRYFSDYQDPGPLYPYSRGEVLRNESRKPHIHHTPVPKAHIPLYTPGQLTSSVTSSSSYRDAAPDYHHVTSYRDTPSYRSSLTTSNTSNTKQQQPGSYSSSNGHRKPPRVTIIREYETNSNGNHSDTAISPTTKTSLFEEFSSSPHHHQQQQQQHSPLIQRGEERSPASYRERHESTSSGERIITPTKYKKQQQKSMSVSSDSGSNFSLSPPPREIIPRSLFPTVSREQSNHHNYSHGSQMNGHSAPSSPVALSPNHPNVVTTDEGQRLKMQVEIGNQFRPDEITVHLRYKKVQIRAIHEDTVDGRSSRSEFSKEFELPGPLEPTTVKAAVNSSGRLYIGGSMMTNASHNHVLDLVLCDMPTNGKACNIKY